jgi:hypothetical protein
MKSIKLISMKAVLFVLLLAPGVFATSETQASTFRGKVVDAETGEPLEGAVVIIVWYRPIFVPCMDSCSKFHQATEAVSQSDGTFAIDSSRPWLAHQRTVQIYKPGYRVANVGALNMEEKSAPDDSLVRLMKLKSLRDYMEDHVQFSVCPSKSKDWSRWCVPPDKIPHYVRLHSLQWKVFGDQRQ